MIEKIAELVLNCNNCVVLTGAGISAESGVPTFRGKEGLWGKFRPEELATMDAFMANPDIVWEWYNWRRDLMGKVEPNKGHYAISDLEKHFQNFTLVTQNVDNLHRIADTKQILELHGNINRNKCADCGKVIEIEHDIDPGNIPHCDHCQGKIRPDVVWFGEMLDADIISGAFDAAERAEIFFTIGTSAVVQPAASLPITAKQRGATLIEINTEETPISGLADFVIQKPSGQFLPQLVEYIEKKKAGE
ncbi:MAG: NAD-dependent deacylase [Calditrichaeota bacterium]|nr:MAG: NAD-dependent deacylase [Calditrichota bacterium]